MKMAQRTAVWGPRARPAVHRTLAAVAVLAVTAGCSVPTIDAPTVRTDGKPAESSAAGSAQPPASTTEPPLEPSAPPPMPSESAASAPSSAPPTDGGQSSSPAADVLLSQGSHGRQVRELQARLAQIGWFDGTPSGVYGKITVAAVRGFQGKRGLPVTGATDTVTWRRLLSMTTEPTDDELKGRTVNKPVATLDPRCLNGRVMCVSKTTRTLSWVVEGKVRATMDVRFGSQYTPTREGSFAVFLKSKDHVSTLYDTPMPYALFFSGGQAVHYSSDFAARGYNGASHGCVNVRDRVAVAALFAEVRKGDKVVIHW